MLKKPDKKILRKSFWGAMGRLISVMMGGCAGSLLGQAIGGSGGVMSISLMIVLSIIGFFLIWITEYERKVE